MKTITINLNEPKSGKSETASADFEDSEMFLFEEYLANADKLNELSIVKEGVLGKINVELIQGEEPLFKTQLPEEEKILSLLHRLRMFILNDEKASYNKITGLILRKFNNSLVKSIIKKHRKIYDGRCFQGAIQVKSNGKIINSEEVLFLWLNSFEYHSDQTKRKEIEKLHQLLPFEVSKALFLMLLTEKIKAIFGIAEIVALLLDKKKSINSMA